MTQLIRVQPTNKTIVQLKNGVRRAGGELWAKRVIAKGGIITNEIGHMLTMVLDKTVVMKSLRGNGPVDLPAHLGLNNTLANNLADGMLELVRLSVRILVRSVMGSIILKIRAVERDWNKYLNLPGAKYISSPSGITIPVVKWLLVDPSIDIGQAAYDIVFRGESKKFDARIYKVSRSKRAIMVSLSQLGGSGGYVLPSIISGSMGHNFIELALRQRGVAQLAAKILMKHAV